MNGKTEAACNLLISDIPKSKTAEIYDFRVFERLNPICEKTYHMRSQVDSKKIISFTIRRRNEDRKRLRIIHKNNRAWL